MPKLQLLFLFHLGLRSIFASPLKVSVYYEALCPDSKNFIVKQLGPAYSKLSSAIELDFVPYGKATHDLIDGKWTFECQHGQQECVGNKYQACALAQKNGAAKDVKYVTCVMKARAPSSVYVLSNCASEAEIEFDPIKECVKSSEGDKILAKYGNQTHKLVPSISFVPTIVYNDKFDQDKQDSSIEDFFLTMCNLIDGTKPVACNN